METFNLQAIKKRSIAGVLTLSLRTVFLQLINFVGYFFITVFLGREEFGVFILVSALIDILAYFSDIGLAAALVQKKEEPSQEEIRSTFTIQQGLVFLLIMLVLLFSPLIKRFYNLGEEGMILVYAFALAFFLSSLKTIPSVLLERKLKFKKIIIPQFIETLSFNLIVVILAWRGWGIKSYTWAVLIRSLLGTLAIYLIAPWKIGLNFSFKILKRLLKFGVPYQMNTFLAVVKDKFMILLLGRLIGSEGVALVGWAEKWSTMPLRYFLDNTVKVAFPSFARLQEDKLRLKMAIEKTFYFLCFLIIPSLTGIIIIAQPLIKIIPRYSKWQPALIPLFLYCFASLFGALAVFLTTVFNSLGKIKTTFKFMLLWTVLTWLFTPFLTIKLGFVGVAVGTVLVNSTSILAMWVIRKYIKVNFTAHFLGPLTASLMMFALAGLIKHYL
ncbi:MAG: oligosaccharide flippase family protein, partial [Candidatus Hermodarchaeota archaeon]